MFNQLSEEVRRALLELCYGTSEGKEDEVCDEKEERANEKATKD